MTRNSADTLIAIDKYDPWSLLLLDPDSCPAIASEAVRSFNRDIGPELESPGIITAALQIDPEICDLGLMPQRYCWRIDTLCSIARMPHEAVYLTWTNQAGASLEASYKTRGTLIFQATTRLSTALENNHVVPLAARVL